MIIWGTPISGLQFFGYSIALGGLLYYKLGSEQIKQYAGAAGRSWSEFGSDRPVARRILTIGAGILAFFLLIGFLTPSDSARAFTDYARGLLGGVMATGLTNSQAA